MKGQKLALLIAGVVLFLVGLVWILMAGGWWLNWLILVVGVVLFVLSFIGKEKPLQRLQQPLLQLPQKLQVNNQVKNQKKNQKKKCNSLYIDFKKPLIFRGFLL